jgi:hypothetical protein
MSDLAKIHSNFAVRTTLDVEGVKFYNVQDDPISIHGVFYKGHSSTMTTASCAGFDVYIGKKRCTSTPLFLPQI